MESLERLASSIAQVELLVASLKRENRDLAARLAASAAERLELREDAEARFESLKLAAEARIEALNLEVEAAREQARPDPELEARVLEAEQQSAGLALRLSGAQSRHLEEKNRLEALIRQLEAQAMAAHGLEQLPVASSEQLAEARERERKALAAQAEAQERTLALAAHLRDLQARLDTLLATEIRVSEEAEDLKVRLAGQQQRVAELEGGIDERERLLNEARLKLAGAVKLEGDQTELKRQRREVSAFAKERHALHRKVEELLATLESVRLG
jgi:hypothetical protein